MGYHAGAGPSMGAPPVQDPPGGGGALTLYVDAASGDDARTRFDAGDPATPAADAAALLDEPRQETQC